MSFNYNPMYPGMPSLLGNLTNGGNFLPGAPPAIHPTNDDFSGKSPSEIEMRLNGGGGGGGGAVGSLMNKTALDIHKQSVGMPKLDPGEEPVNSPKLTGIFNGVGGGLGPQNYMMLSRMMIDPTMMSIQAAAAAAQYPLFSQLSGPASNQQQHQGPPPPPSSVSQSPQMQLNPAAVVAQHSLQSQQSNLNGGTETNNSLMKELISTTSCTLFPPNPTVPPPTTRDRPPGCRTVFVGGLPENITEEIIREVFDRCGEITTLRLSKKNFCHIRFAFEASVESAIYLSGYRMRIGNQSDTANCGRLHVDYAQARDDQYDYECKQRQLQREQRHRERLERDRLRPLSPPVIIHYTDHEASSVSEKLKQDDTFAKAVQTLITWLERGDCCKKNSNSFYSMIQSTNSHVRRLANEKQTCEDELRRAKELYNKHMQSMVVQCKWLFVEFGVF